jgi:hypothetical protein
MCQTYFKVLVSNHKLDKSTASNHGFPPAAAGTLERRSDPDFDDKHAPRGKHTKRCGTPMGKPVWENDLQWWIFHIYLGLPEAIGESPAGDGNIWMSRHGPGHERKTQRGSIKKGANEQVVSR